MKLAYLMIAASFVVGCGGDKKPAETPTTVTTSTASAAPAPNPEARQAVGSTLTVSDEIYRLCHLQAQSQTEATPKFAFDDTLITKSDALVLDQIAVCLTTGPLANRKVKLTGRADPRGTEEYNMSLGAKRAHAVSSYLQLHKVAGAALGETSRGALDATGTDEATWAKDRRVDISLQQ
jgi:outer membrane protein OmpA-like peptidoglycan-associated protein